MLPKMKSEYAAADELLPEYDLGALLREGVQGKVAGRCAEGTSLVLLEPDVAAAFPSDEAVNEALKLVIQLTRLSAPGKLPIS
jgi:hypothetical protein